MYALFWSNFSDHESQDDNHDNVTDCVDWHGLFIINLPFIFGSTEHCSYLIWFQNWTWSDPRPCPSDNLTILCGSIPGQYRGVLIEIILIYCDPQLI